MALRVARLLLLAAWLSPAAEAQERPALPGADLSAWASGPVRWLLLPAEIGQLRDVASPAESVRFVDRFWALRDPDPATAANPFRDTFYKRVEAADLLYVENQVRGSLTARGRALILLGPPSHLRVTSQEALEWDPAAGTDDNVRIRYLPLEIWTYRLEDLRPALARALMAVSEATEFRLSFVRDVGSTTLSEGEQLLELAARTAVALGSEK